MLTKVATYIFVNWIVDQAYSGWQLILALKGEKYNGKGKCRNMQRKTHTDTYCEDRAEIPKSEFSFRKTSKCFKRSHLLMLWMLNIKRRNVLSSLYRFIFKCWIIKRLSVFFSSLKPEIASILAQMPLMLVCFSTPYLSSPNGLLSSCKWDILISVHPNFSEQVCVWLHLL